jgi:hypothetical protein
MVQALQMNDDQTREVIGLVRRLRTAWKGFVRIDPFSDPDDVLHFAAEVLPQVFRCQDDWERWMNHLVLRRKVGPHIALALLPQRQDHTLGDWLLRHLDTEVGKLARVCGAWHRVKAV